MMRIATFILPQHDNNGESLADVHLALRSAAIDAWGGFTAIPSDGGWRGPNGRIMIEPGVAYQIAMDDTARERARLESFALFYGHMAQQECVMVTHADGSVVFVACAAFITEPSPIPSETQLFPPSKLESV